ncbi:flippase [Neotamlana nanhaiensis]|uniref:flippase n=1 Tax=Neotamlana nanhaiensis TaxID=1382798 RepID=UPI0005CBA4E0|nr:flippase [Tamlana nanhaiensis]
MIKQLKNKLKHLDENTIDVFKKFIPTTMVKVGGVVFGFLISLYLANVLGADGLGVIELMNKITAIVIVFCLLGVRQLIIKEVAISYLKDNWERIGYFIYTSIIISGTITFVVALILVFSASFISTAFSISELRTPLVIGSIVMVFQVVSQILSSGIIGLKRIWQGSLIDQTLSLVLIGVLLLAFYVFKINIDIVATAIIYAISRIIVLICASIYWKNIFLNKSYNLNFDFKLVKKSLPFLLLAATGIIASNIDSIMLGWLSTAKNVGLYAIAFRLAFLSVFFLNITNAALSPKIAEMYANNKLKELNKMVQNVTLGLWFVALIPLIIFVFFGEYLLVLWGEEFRYAYWPLIILSIGQLFNIGTGAAGLTLVMCGFEKIQAYISMGVIFLNTILNYFFIISFDVTGAAIATTITLAIGNIAKLIFAKHKTGVYTLPI